MSDLTPWVRLAGTIQLAVALANLALPRVLDYRRQVASLSPVVRQIFVVHSVYIVLVLLIFGGLCLGFPAALTDGSPAARYLAASLAVFWLLRVGLQLFYYDRVFRRDRPWLDRAWLALTSYLALVFTLAATAS